MVVIVSIRPLSFLNNHTGSPALCPDTALGAWLEKLLFTQGALTSIWVGHTYHGSNNRAACLGLLYFPLMFSLNAGALIIASVRFVRRVYYHKSIDMWRQFVPRIRCHRFVISNVMVCSIFLRTRPLTKLPRHVGCMFRPKSANTNTNTKPCFVFSVIKIREYALKDTRFYQECYARLSMVRLEIPRPIWRHRISLSNSVSFDSRGFRGSNPQTNQMVHFARTYFSKSIGIGKWE